MMPYLISKDFDLRQLHDTGTTPIFSSDNLAMFALDTNPSIPTNNGVGILAEAISCKTTHRLNGEDELVMEYPITGYLFSEIQLHVTCHMELVEI